MSFSKHLRNSINKPINVSKCIAEYFWERFYCHDCKNIKQRNRYLQRLQQHSWSKEYLPRLTMRQKWLQKKTPLKPDDVVLVYMLEIFVL